MPIRYFSFLSLGLAAGFLVVASQAFALFDIANLALGVGIGMLVVGLAVAILYRRHWPSVTIGAAVAIVSAGMIVASQVFSLETVQNLTFAEALGIVGLAIAGLTAHELTTERVVHSLSLERAGEDNYTAPAEPAGARDYAGPLLGGAVRS
ncbi:MAG TPA: hypothetical protein VMB51_09195 [Solirubrobacteraceae bacterium]|nr:hypothetical protein [Solirubrobacteraceae bacterium]